MTAYIYGWLKTDSSVSLSPDKKTEPITFVSIIIPVRNEENNILNCLTSIYRQTYPVTKFEIIIVNDHSEDSTYDLVKSKQDHNFSIINLSKSQSGKKRAIAEGIKISKGNLIVTTDADCEVGEKWLTEIILVYETKKPKMIIGPVLFTGENNIQQQMQSQEMTVLTACACASLYWKKPILCSGANLIFEKNAFMDVNGFDDIDHTATGDDIFLMLKFNKKFPREICYLKSKEAVAFTRPERSALRALKQRKRWASKSFHYRFSHVTLIAMLVFFMNLLIVGTGILAIMYNKFVLALTVCVSVKFLVDFMLLYFASSFFQKKINPFIVGFVSLVYPFYVSIIGIVSPLTNYSWKGRKS
jgi:poly-beta-1,6-N-acetyl-D-glucosamine synthase